MAAHMQQQILAALAATLVAAGTAAGTRVYVDHPDELTAAMLPAIVIEAGAEQVVTETYGQPALQTRAWEVDVIAVTRGTGAAAAARNLAAQVEVALYAAPGAAGPAKSLSLQSSAPQTDGETAQIVAQLRQSWQIVYATLTGAPDATA